MLQTTARRGLAGGTALLVGLAGLAIGQGAAQAVAPLSVDQAGPVVAWGPPGDPETTGAGVPVLTPEQASAAVVKVVANTGSSALALTADGKVEELGYNSYTHHGYPQDAPPAELAGKTVVDIAGDANYGNGMAITDTGDVYTWSIGFEGWTDTELKPSAAELKGSTTGAISSSGDLAAVVKAGKVLIWGNTQNTGEYGQLTPPEDLTDVTSVFFDSWSATVYALKADGTLAAWGREANGMTDLPDVVTDATDEVDVTDVATAGSGAIALLSDGSLATWGIDTAGGAVYAPPAALAGKDVAALASNGGTFFAVTSDGSVYHWGDAADPAFDELPAGVDPANITGLAVNYGYAIAIQATFGYLSRPAVSGTPKVGQTLTATPAKYTAEPEALERQWLANGQPIAGATGATYKLTAAEVGKRITYRETATRGEATATATSDPTAAVAKAGPTAQEQKVAQAERAYAAATAAVGVARSALATASAPKTVKAYIKALAKVTKAQNKVTAAKAKVAKAKGKAAKTKAKKALTKAKKALTKAKKALKKSQKKAGAAGKRYRAALAAYNAAVKAQAAAAQALANARAGK